MINFKIAELMGRYRLTKKAVSEKTGIRPNTVSALWHGTAKRIEVDHVDKLCSTLKCQPGDLMEYVSEEDK